MALRRSKQAQRRNPPMHALGASNTIPLVFEHVTVTGQFAAGDIIEMGALPAGMIPVTLPKLIAQDVDANGAPALTMDVGLMTGQYLFDLDDAGAARTMGAEFFAASTIGQAGGVATSTVLAGMVLVPSPVDRSIGLKVVAAAATLTAGAKIRLLMLVATAPPGMLEA